MKRDLLVIIGLVLVTAAAFRGVGACGFVNFDDDIYIVNNPHVSGGVAWSNIKWAWTTFYAGNYLPLTWISLMLDATLFGSGPHGFHWMNVSFHAANGVLVYLWFRLATGSVRRSGLVAAIFAVHPLRVESVVWVVERKDVLTAFFALLAMLAYLRFVRTPRWSWYACVVGLFGAALLAKQTLATLPFLLLLLDYWPLGRWARGPAPAGPGAAGIPRRSVPLLVLEKVPLLLMAIAIGFVTVKAQATTRSVVSLTQVPLTDRLANTPVSYVRYLGKMVWFGNLAVFYPRQAWSAVQVAGAFSLLGAVTAAAVAILRSRPWVAVGWFWYLGVLVPMIGLVQFADQSMADRFTYMAGIGLLVAAVWSIPSTWVRHMPALSIATTVTVLGTLCLFTLVQISYWRNSITLFAHDIEVAGSSVTPECNLASALIDANRPADAYAHLAAAMRLDPYHAPAHDLFAHLLLAAGDNAAAERESRFATELAPRFAEAHNDHGVALWRMGRLDEAADEFQSALAINPDLAPARKNLSQISVARETAPMANPPGSASARHTARGSLQ